MFRKSPESRVGLKPIGHPVVLLLPGVAWLLLFGLAPLGFMLVMSFWKSSIFGTTPDLNIGNYARLVDSPLYGGLLLKTLRVAFASTLIALVISYPVAYFLTRLSPRWKAVFVLLMFLPFWTSYVVRTFVWLPILGRNGAINGALAWLGLIDEPLEWLLFNEGAVYLGLVYVYTLFMTLPIYLSLEKIDPRLIEAAADPRRASDVGVHQDHPAAELAGCPFRLPHGVPAGRERLRDPPAPRRNVRDHVRQRDRQPVSRGQQLGIRGDAVGDPDRGGGGAAAGRGTVDRDSAGVHRGAVLT